VRPAGFGLTMMVPRERGVERNTLYPECLTRLTPCISDPFLKSNAIIAMSNSIVLFVRRA
jgi:hypothetical protein